MAKNPQYCLTPHEHEAVASYAKANGRRWKAKLSDDWMNARTEGTLQQLRNTHGPSWLAGFKLREAA